MDPEEMFGAIFGGERFKPLIGELSLARDMKSAMQEADDPETSTAVTRPGEKRVLSPDERLKKDEKEKVRQAEVRCIHERLNINVLRFHPLREPQPEKKRVSQLVVELVRKISIFTESATGIPARDREVTLSWKTICQLDAEFVNALSPNLCLLTISTIES